MQLSNIELLAAAILEFEHVACDTIEYQKSDTCKDEILKTACAYANDYMRRDIGFIFIGIEEAYELDGTKAMPLRPIVGVEESKLEPTENKLEKLLAKIHPRIDYHLLKVEADGKFCVVIAVEPGTAGPYATSEKAQKTNGLKPGRYIRVGRESRLPNKREELELMKKFADVHFSSELNRTATIDDLDYGWIQEYLTRTNASEETRGLGKLDMAEAMGLVSGSEYGERRAKNFAVLMFCNRPQDFIPYARVEIIRERRDTDRMVATVFDGPVWIQVERAVDFFRETIMSTYTVLEDGRTEHRMVSNWPELAFRELLTNAVVHKDYDRAEYVGVYVYEDAIEIINHNRPLPPVTIEALNSQTRFPDRSYLNPELKDMFFALGLIETYGSGIRRAKESMVRNGNPPLTFKPADEENDYTMVTMPINEEFARIRDEEAGDIEATEIANKAISGTGEETDGTGKETGEETGVTGEETGKETGVTGEETVAVRDRIVRMLVMEPKITVKEIAGRIGLSPNGVRYHLDILRHDGVVRREGSTKSGAWIVVGKADGHAEG